MNHAFPIRNDEDLVRAMNLIDALWDAAEGTPDHDLLHVMSELVDAYNARRSTLPAMDPRDLVRLKLKELGWSQRELARRVGWGSGRVSEVLGGKRPLTLAMVRSLSAVLDLPPGLLVHDRLDADATVWVPVSGADAVQLSRAAEVAGKSPSDRGVDLVRDALRAQVSAATSSQTLVSGGGGPPCRPHLSVVSCSKRAA